MEVLTTLESLTRFEPLRLVCASRETEANFDTGTALGRSLGVNRHHDYEMRLFCSNTRGLPAIYNIAIEDAKRAPAILVFIHDDVELSDYFWSDNIRAGLLEFDLIGVEGNRRRVPNQMAWAFHDESMVRDAEYLSGAIGKSDHYGRFINYYGPSFQAVKLLDGVLLAARSDLFHAFDIRFDEQFDFHFYDLDLCRQAELEGLNMGTWGISIVHESRGAFLSPEWRSAYQKYLAKWKS